MPIQISNKQFADVFSNVTSYYQANAGDRIAVELDLTECIRVQSGGANNFSLDPINNIIIWATGNFLDEGFRDNDDVEINVYTNGGSIISSTVTNVTNVTANQLDVNSIPVWYDFTAGEILRVTVTGRKREGLIVNLNHVQNGATGTKFSLIDGEVTTFTFDISGTTTGDTITGTQVGNRSGQFDCIVDITDNTIYPNDVRNYQLSMLVIQAGQYNESSFDTSGALKLFVQTNWQSLLGEPYNQLTFTFSEDANTGWFNQAYNIGTPAGTIVQQITSLDYAIPTSGQFVIDWLSSSDWGIGGAYYSTDDAYYRNRPFSQSQLSMVLPSTPLGYGSAFSSQLNEDGAAWTMNVTGVTTVGTISTFDFVFTPNAAFNTFMDGRVIGDRTMYIWVKIDNINLLIYSGQLTKSPPVAGELLVAKSTFFDHGQNYDYITDSTTGFIGDIEDDIEFGGVFLLEKGVIYDSFTGRIEAFNNVTGEKFTLHQAFYDLSSIPFNGTNQIIYQQQPILTQLPTTSDKRDSRLELSPSDDTITHYGVLFTLPFLYRWEYWLAQINADADFYPFDQTRNWFPYANTTNWKIRLHCEAVTGGLAYVFDNDLTLKNYASNADIDQTMELIINSTNDVVGVVVENELMRVIAYHELTNGEIWDATNIWGMITIEPYENAPRNIISSAIGYDGNPNNPLTPLTGGIGSVTPITYPSPEIARMECYFNPNLVNLTNGVKFTIKIKGCTTSKDLLKITTRNDEKITTDNQFKIIA
jgi:hypothetical protein